MSILSSVSRRRVAAAAVLSATLALAACSTGGVDYGPGPVRPGRPAVCTAEYVPVCGARGGERRTFSNACEAHANGHDILGRGECRFDRPDRRPDEERMSRPGRDRGDWREADRRQDRTARDRDSDRGDWRDGERRQERERRDGRNDRRERERPRVCTMEYRPVCAVSGRTRQTFGNACSAEAEGFRVVSQGDCPAR